MIVYYAHCMSIYGTPQEERDVALLGRLGWRVVNPNTPQTQSRIACLEERDGMGKLEVMERVFRPMVDGADVIAFRALPDGSISSGVIRELGFASGQPIIELPASVQRRALTLDLTREYLREVGQR